MIAKKRIRFIPRTGDLVNHPVDRMRCANVMKGLREIGYDAELFRGDEEFDLLVTLSLDFARWGPVYRACKTKRIPMVLDLAENEFERSTKITAAKIAGSLRAKKQGSSSLISRIRGFFRRKRFDWEFFGFLPDCSAITGSSKTVAAAASQYCGKTAYIPDMVELDHYRPKTDYQTDPPLKIVWTGTPNCVHFLGQVDAAIKAIREKSGAKMVVITSPEYAALQAHALEHFRFQFEFRPWAFQTIGNELASCDIAIAPLPASSYKSSNKVVTYWACGLPVVASNTQAYQEIIRHGENGFVARNEKEWEECLAKLVVDSTLRRAIGEQGRKDAIDKFSPESIAAQWANLLSKLLQAHQTT